MQPTVQQSKEKAEAMHNVPGRGEEGLSQKQLTLSYPFFFVCLIKKKSHDVCFITFMRITPSSLVLVGLFPAFPFPFLSSLHLCE